jgi:hypothetical protein
MKISDFNLEKILKIMRANKSKTCKKMIQFIIFLFSYPVMELCEELDDNFKAKKGRPAYPRVLLLGVVIFCIFKRCDTFKEIENMLDDSRYLLIFTRGKIPKIGTIKSFLQDTTPLFFRKIFLLVLMEFNENNLLKFLKIFIDGTDAIIRASRFNKITRKQFEAFLTLYKHNLLEKENSKTSIDIFKRKLEEYMIVYKNDHEVLDALKIAFKFPIFYNETFISRIDEFKEKFNERNSKVLSVTFPESVLMRTKRGRFDFAFNLQLVMTEKNILLSSPLLSLPNDHGVLEYVLKDLYLNFEILIELIKKYGERKNYKELLNMVKKAKKIMDSGYYDLKNLKTLIKYDENGVINDKKTSRYKNTKLKDEEKIKKGITIPQKEKFSKNHMKPVSNGLICSENQLIEFKEIIPIKTKINLSKEENEREYYKIFSGEKVCKNCKSKNNCLKDGEEYKIIKEISNPIYDWMLKKNKHWGNKNISKERMQAGESCNGFFKGIYEIHLPGSTQETVQNFMHLKGAVYNKIRLKNLKQEYSLP